MSARDLSAAVLALYPEQVTVHDGQVASVDGKVPSPPWVYVTFTLPRTSERSLARPGRLVDVRVRSLCYGANATAVRAVADKVMDALEGVRPVVAGWRTSPLELINTREAVQDRDVTVTGTNAHPMFGVLEHVFTASPTS